MTDLSIPDLNLALSGRYVVEREIATGGMATVYLVLDEKHQRRVALKVMKTAVADGAGTSRFLREVGVTARLAHPHILPLLDSGDVLGLPYYAMPFVEGETLRERITREGRLSVAEAVHLAAEVADALAYAHAQGIIHRDIKPANILLSGRHAIVADFGVAKALSPLPVETDVDDITREGNAVGTIAYMSPEQAVGEPNLDGRSDLFSLGIVLFEMLVGEKAFGGTTVQEQMARRFTGVVPSARARRVEVPQELDVVLRKALARDPVDRYATAGEFESALLAALRGATAPFATGAIHVARAPEEVPSIAVLPFRNLGGDVDSTYLSDGITEEILTQLSLRRTMRVCARHSSFAFREATDDVQTIGSRLGVRHLLTGSVRRAGERLRVTAQLVDASTGFQGWSGRYDRAVADVFAIQDEIGAAIAHALNVTLLGELSAPSQVAAPRIEVYDAVLKARHAWNQRTDQAMQGAIDAYREALRLDPEYAPAWAGLAQVYVTRGVYGHVAPREVLPLARQAAGEALRRDPSLAEARVALGQVEAVDAWQWDAAEATFRQAIALNPLLPAAHQGLAIMSLTPRGRHAEARESIERALAIDPLSPVLRATLASLLLYGRQFGEALRVAGQLVEAEPGFGLAHFFLAQVLTATGDHAAAVAHAESAVQASRRSGEALAVLACAQAAAGARDSAERIHQELEGRSRDTYTSHAHRAVVAAALGRTESALDLLDAAAAEHAPDLLWLGVRPAWDTLRPHPRFTALLQRLHLAPA
ncbi:MAG: protein kinase [Gemmatimonadetes bacterium]|nr:protein kinase [Gemmatimonadota bacterium]